MPTATLATILAELARYEATETPASPISVAVLRNHTVETMVPLLKYHLFSNGLKPTVDLGGYDTIQQEVLDPGSVAYDPRRDLIVVTWFLDHLDPQSRRRGWDPAKAIDTVDSTLSHLCERSESTVVASTFLPPLHADNELLSGSLDGHRVDGVRRLNDCLRELAARHSDQLYLVDIERLVQRLGEDRALDYRFQYMNRAPYSKDLLDLFAQQVAIVGRLSKGQVKKVLVLDCDNTLWGGVIGEDQLEGIQLSAHDYPGRCFYEFQQSVLNLYEQGVVIALASKNNENDVWEVLDKHPECPLGREHLATWRVDWNDKASNITSMASELNLGLDSFVFVDDSGIECELVRQTVPEVTVVQVPETPYDLPSLLPKSGLFETLSVSSEDSRRTQLYRAERERKRSQESFRDLDGFLRSLNLRAEIAEATESEVARVAQLCGKTNQFNVTTKRHTEAQIRAFAERDDAAVFVMSAGDNFGDLGLIAVLIAEHADGTGTVDTLLMSCRALGRQLERVFTHHCLSELEARWGVESWQSSYERTKKNALVENLWEELGFQLEEQSDEFKSYSLATSARQSPAIDYVAVSTPGNAVC